MTALHLATSADARFSEMDRQCQQARDDQRAKDAAALVGSLKRQSDLMLSFDPRVRAAAQKRFGEILKGARV